MKNNSTMKDVAKMANVSIASVSRFLNGQNNHLSDRTAQRIDSVIKKLNYIPDENARSLVTKKSKVIAVLVANVNDYFSTEIFKGINSFLTKKGYTGVLLDSNNSQEIEIKTLNLISNQGIFGGILLQPLTTDIEIIKKSVSKRTPLVLLDRSLKNSPWSSVVTNNYNISREAAKYFKDSGLTNIVVITNNIKNVSTREERYAGISSIYNNPITIKPGENKADYDKAYIHIKKILDNSCNTIIFSLKERWLLEFLPRLINDGYIYDKSLIKVTGFSDTDLIYAIDSQIQVIKQDPYTIGKRATEIIIDEIENKLNKKKSIEIPAKFKKDNCL